MAQNSVEGSTFMMLLIISHTTSYQHSVLFFNIVTIFSLVVAIFQNIYKDGIFKITKDQ